MQEFKVSYLKIASILFSIYAVSACSPKKAHNGAPAPAVVPASTPSTNQAPAPEPVATPDETQVAAPEPAESSAPAPSPHESDKPKSPDKAPTIAQPRPAKPSSADLGEKIFFAKKGGETDFTIVYSYPDNISWNIRFSMDMRPLVHGRPVRNLAWRLWDQYKNQVIKDWDVAVQDDHGVYYPGITSFDWSVTDSKTVHRIINAHQDAYLEFSIDGEKDKFRSDYYINLGEYCNQHSAGFFNVSTSQYGCRIGMGADKPPQPATLPKTTHKLDVSRILTVANHYCDNVKDLMDQTANMTLKVAVEAKLRQEQKLARALCSDHNKFVGYTDIVDRNTRAVVAVEAARDAFAKLEEAARLAGVDSVQSEVSTWNGHFAKALQMDYGDGAIRSVFGSAVMQKPDFQEKWKELAAWGAALNKFYRSN